MDDGRPAAELLTTRGQELLAGASRPTLLPDAPANALVTDLTRYPHAFVIACICDRQVKAERAWAIPYELSRPQRLGTFEFPDLARLDASDFSRAMREPTPLHRFPEVIGQNVHAGLQVIAERYAGRADSIWLGSPTSAAIVYRFLEFPGVGPKIATMAANLLVREFRIPLRDHYSIDVSVDVQVRRVFRRLGLVRPDSSDEEIIYRARDLNPTYPGVFDAAAWDVGRQWCHQRHPACASCYMNSACPSAGRIP